MFSYTFSNYERGTDNGLDGTIAVGAASVAGNTLPQTCASTSGLDPGAITTRLDCHEPAAPDLQPASDMTTSADRHLC